MESKPKPRIPRATGPDSLRRRASVLGTIAKAFNTNAPKTVLLPVYAQKIDVTPAIGYAYTALYDPVGDTVVGDITGTGTIPIPKDPNNQDVWDLTQLLLVGNTDKDAFAVWRAAVQGGGSPDSGSAGNGNGHT